MSCVPPSSHLAWLTYAILRQIGQNQAFAKWGSIGRARRRCPPRRTPPKLDRRAASVPPKLADQPHRRLSHRKMVKRSGRRLKRCPLACRGLTALSAPPVWALTPQVGCSSGTPMRSSGLHANPCPDGTLTLAGTILKALLEHQVSSSLLAESHRLGACSTPAHQRHSISVRPGTIRAWPKLLRRRANLAPDEDRPVARHHFSPGVFRRTPDQPDPAARGAVGSALSGLS
jgi:hypothetical protein